MSLSDLIRTRSQINFHHAIFAALVAGLDEPILFIHMRPTPVVITETEDEPKPSHLSPILVEVLLSILVDALACHSSDSPRIPHL